MEKEPTGRWVWVMSALSGAVICLIMWVYAAHDGSHLLTWEYFESWWPAFLSSPFVGLLVGRVWEMVRDADITSQATKAARESKERHDAIRADYELLKPIAANAKSKLEEYQQGFQNSLMAGHFINIAFLACHVHIKTGMLNVSLQVIDRSHLQSKILSVQLKDVSQVTGFATIGMTGTQKLNLEIDANGNFTHEHYLKPLCAVEIKPPAPRPQTILISMTVIVKLQLEGSQPEILIPNIHTGAVVCDD